MLDPAKTRRPRRLLALGIGNTLFSDDGIGSVAARALKLKTRSGVMVADIGVAMLEAVPLLEWADRVLVIDATQAGGNPGSIYWFEYAGANYQPASRCCHARDLSVALELIPKHIHLPDVYVLGIEPGSLELGFELSSQLKESLPRLVTTADRILGDWRAEQRLVRR